MTIQVTISSIVGTSPYNLYVCQEDGSNCFYIDRITSEQLPYIFDIPAPYNNSESYMFKVVDDYGSVSTGTTNLYASPTPTSTVTPTITPSSSPTPTTTHTPTVTATVTITPTPSVSQSPGASPSVTPTNTFTPTLTSTLTPTPSVSETPGPSPSPTSTFTPTPSVSETPDASPTPTLTQTPTVSETPASTTTPTLSETPEPTTTPTLTETPEPTITPTSSQTPNPTTTPTITPSPQPPNPSLILDFDASISNNFTPTASEGVEASYWNNLVVGGLPFTGTSAFNSPIWETLPSYNNLGSLEFSNGKRLWANLQNNFESATGYTLFWVFNTTSLTTLQFILNTTTTNPSSGSGEIFAFMDSANSLELQYINSSVYQRFTWTTNVTLLTVVYDGSLSSEQRLKVRINGVDATPISSGGNWPSSLNSFYGLNLSSVGGAFPLLGNVGALKFYNSAIDSSEISSVENQLITKFGI
jgi:hypothetical protein